MTKRFIDDPSAHLCEERRRRRQYTLLGQIQNSADFQLSRARHAAGKRLEGFNRATPGEAILLIIGAILLSIFRVLQQISTLQIIWGESSRHKLTEPRILGCHRRERLFVIVLLGLSVLVLTQILH